MSMSEVKGQVTEDTKARCALLPPLAGTEWSRLLYAARCSELSTGRPACGLCLENIFALVFGQLHALHHAASKSVTTVKKTLKWL